MKTPILRLGSVLIFILLLSGRTCILHAQDEKKFQLYTTGNGLSDNYITGVVQDCQGYIWAGTYRGLNRYDGKQFIQFHSSSNIKSLPDEGVTKLIKLDPLRLAALTGMGVHIIDAMRGETDDLIIPAPDPKYMNKFNEIMCTLNDEQGNIYISTRSGFYHFDPLHKLAFRFDYYNKRETETEEFEFGEEACWLSPFEIIVHAVDGGYIYNTQTRQLNKIKITDPYLSEFAAMSHDAYVIRQTDHDNFVLIRDGSDSIVYYDNRLKRKISSKTWVSNLVDEFNWRTRLFKVNDTLFYISSKQNGFFKMSLNRETGKIILDTRRYFPGYLCTDFTMARDKRLWISTNAGLLKEMNNSSSVQQASIPDHILKQKPGMNIKQLFCYKDKLYVACAGNGGLLAFDKNSLSFLHEISLDKIISGAKNVFSILHARGDTLFIGTDGPLIWLNTNNDLIGEVQLDGFIKKNRNWISYQFKDSRGNIWVTTNDNSKTYVLESGTSNFRRLDFNSELFKKILIPTSIREDRDGNIWISGHGVCRINRNTGKPDLYLDSFPSIRFARRELTTIQFDNKNELWLGIYNNGLASYNIGKGTFRQYTCNEGLPDNEIRSIYPMQNKLWIATTTGIASLDMRNNKISRFSGDDGFSPLIVSSRDFFYDSSAHYLYSGFTTNIVRFDPDSLLYARLAPSFFIENISFLNDTSYYLPHGTITVPYNKNDLAVTISTINYNDVNNQRIAYRIANSENTPWQPLETNLINFNNLSPGLYRLQIKLYAANNRWQEQIKEINIRIDPPLWKTAWFIALMTFLLLSFIYIIYRTNISMVRKKERSKALMQELKAEEYKYRLELEKISHYFSSSLSGKKNINEILWGVAGKLIGEMGYEDCMIYLWNADKTKMLQKAGYGPKGSPEALSSHVFEVKPGQGIVGHVMQTKKPLIVADTRKDRRYREDEMFRLSEICVPIIHNGELLGVIDSEHQNANFYKERDLKILTTIATLVGNKMKEVEFEESLAVKREELATINEQLAEAQLTALQTQMNPHFIFNALNSIKRMILDNETKSASRYLSKFAQMIRMTLNHSKETFVTLQETIEYLHAYLGMEQLRFGSSFSYKIETTGKPEEEEINIPTLMIQPLAENAIWHGLMHKKGDKKIVIRFVETDDMVTCTIEDNGIGIRQSEKMKMVSKRPHVGLDNLRNRIKIMNKKYDMNCSLDIADLGERNDDQTGTLVTLKFRILNQ